MHVWELIPKLILRLVVQTRRNALKVLLHTLFTVQHLPNTSHDALHSHPLSTLQRYLVANVYLYSILCHVSNFASVCCLLLPQP